MTQKKRVLIIYIFLTVVTITAFWQVRNCDFVNLDDPVYVTRNGHIQNGLSMEGLWWAFTTSHGSFWHPLTWLSLMLDNQLYGLKPTGYHLTNLILHVLSTLLLFWFFNRITGALWRSAFIAALFALHPLHVESVAWVTERKDTLSTFFFMLALCAYVSYTEKPRAYRYLFSLLCFAFGLMSKPMLVTLPFVLVLLDYWPLNRFHFTKALPNQPSVTPGAGDHKNPKDRLKKGAVKKNAIPSNNARLSMNIRPSGVLLRLLKEKTPFFALFIIFSAVAFYAQHKVSYLTFPLGTRIANALVAYMVYIEKTLWPHDLAVFYPFPSQLPAWQVLAAALLLFIISVAVIYAAKRFPYLFVGWLWYIGTLVPVIGIIQVGKHALADRYTYIPLIGLFVIAAWGIPELLKKWRYRQEVLFVSSMVILSCCFLLTWTQVGYWRNSITLFEHALKVTDYNALAHNNLGIALRGAGKTDEAEYHYRQSIGIQPDNEQAHFNLGNLFFATSRIDKAVAHYTEALRIKPQYGNAHANLGVAYMSQNKFQEAIVHFQKAIAVGYGDAGTYFNLGAAFLANGQPEEASSRFREAIRISPGFAEAYNELGRILAMEGKMEEAIGYFKEAIMLRPDFAAARNNLKVALSASKKQ